ncbi:hypothetical protein RRG08_016501 [Elysia crispata]|uniref:Uncharacterized protein n=1 Tax=Elysia crispata TaxID=231223 RepID=A0AAE1CUM9_9GAST|nr:hypothetical protein RRG08_016501 [Elysia crispata]
MARPRKVKQPVSGQQNFVRTVTGHPPRASVAGVISLTSWPFPLWSKVVRPDRDRPSPLARTLIAVWRPKKRGGAAGLGARASDVSLCLGVVLVFRSPDPVTRTLAGSRVRGQRQTQEQACQLKLDRDLPALATPLKKKKYKAAMQAVPSPSKSGIARAILLVQDLRHVTADVIDIIRLISERGEVSADNAFLRRTC